MPPTETPGVVAISVSIKPDGTVGSMHLDSGLPDEAMNKAAWTAVAGTKYAPLPWGFGRPELHLRLRFFAAS